MLRRPFPALVAVVAFAVVSLAQCEPQWLQGDPIATPTGSVAALTSWDPDGAGPSAPLLVSTGSLTFGHSAEVSVAAWDGTQWSPLGTPPVGVGIAATVWNGQLVVAVAEAGVPGGSVQTWNGTSWQLLGTTPSGQTRVLAVHQGQLYVGGWFSSFGGVTAQNVARWDGVAWSAVGGGRPLGATAMASFQNVLHVATHSGAPNTPGQLDVWNGTTWVPIATANDVIDALAVRVTTSITSTYLYAAGAFTQWTPAGGVAFTAKMVARFSPSANTWTSVGTNLNTRCRAIVARPTGMLSTELVVMRDGSLNQGGLWRWDGSNWVQLAAGDGKALLWFAGAYHAGSSTPSRLQNGFWQALRMPTTSPGHASAVIDDGTEIVIGGSFGLRRGQPGAWNPFGTGPTGSVWRLARRANGDLLVVHGTEVSRWDGTTWWPMTPGGANGEVRALLPLPDGQVIAGGAFTSIGGVAAAHIARWDGQSWHPLQGGTNAPVNALARLPNGDVVAGGEFTLAGSLIGTALHVARWDGAQWSGIGTGLPEPVFDVAVTAMGGIAVTLTDAIPTIDGNRYAARWTGGSTWEVLPLAATGRFLPLPDGDLLFAGRDWPALVRLHVPFGPFDVSELHVSGPVQALVAAEDGDVLMGGGFETVGVADPAVGLTVSVGFARLAATCPATSAAHGQGCNGQTLVATTLPWVDGTFRASANGLPSPSIVVALTSLAALPQGAAPLASLLPQGVAGCDLLVAPDIVEAIATVTGAAQSQLFLPNVPPLVGVTFFHQMVPFAVDALGNVTTITATNALRLVAGDF